MSRPSLPRRLRAATTAAATVVGTLALLATSAPAAPAAHSPAAVPTSATYAAAATKAETRPTPVTPGDFSGYGFDQCLAPTQAAMDTWLERSPYLAVGIYISGDSRACRSQPNLTPEWIRTQLLKGWRLLPITLGPQASCQPRFPRYRDDFKIDPFAGAGRYPRAREMGRVSGASTVDDATALGIPAGSTLWYDLEGFDSTDTACRESALAFLSTWVTTVRKLGYVTGVYSSAGSGIKVIDDARVERPGAFALPDRIWIARWDGLANTSTSYIRPDGWHPGGRVKQYRGGHDEVWGGVRINIDTNYLDMGRGSVATAESHCGGVPISFQVYRTLEPNRSGYVAPVSQVKALQCLLQERGVYTGEIDGLYRSVVPAVRTWRAAAGLPATKTWYANNWMTLLSFGRVPVLKVGSAGVYVRRVQRTLNAADLGVKARAVGVFSPATVDAVKAYQKKVGLPATGIVDSATWSKLQHGVS